MGLNFFHPDRRALRSKLTLDLWMHSSLSHLSLWTEIHLLLFRGELERPSISWGCGGISCIVSDEPSPHDLPV